MQYDREEGSGPGGHAKTSSSTLFKTSTVKSEFSAKVKVESKMSDEMEVDSADYSYAPMKSSTGTSASGGTKSTASSIRSFILYVVGLLTYSDDEVPTALPEHVMI